MALFSTSTLSGNNVVNIEGDSLGSIKDFVIDTRTGHVAYAVLSFGGFLGMGDKLFAVPLDAMRLDTENERFMLDVDKDRLDDMPGFDEDNWPSSADDAFTQQVYDYYDLPLYQEQRPRAAY